MLLVILRFRLMDCCIAMSLLLFTTKSARYSFPFVPLGLLKLHELRLILNAVLCLEEIHGLFPASKHSKCQIAVQETSAFSHVPKF